MSIMAAIVRGEEHASSPLGWSPPPVEDTRNGDREREDGESELLRHQARSSLRKTSRA
jgi:hypothetical protein